MDWLSSLGDQGEYASCEAFGRAMRMIWFAMTLAVLLYGFVLYVIAPPGGEPIAAEWAARLRIPFAGSALGLALIAFFLRRHAFEVDVVEQRLSQGESPGRALASQQGNYLLLLGLHECVVLLGFIQGVVGEGLYDFAPYAAVATVLNLLAFPRLDALTRELRLRNPERFRDPVA